VQNGQGHLPYCSAMKNWDSSKAWSWKSTKNGSGIVLPNAKQTQAINQDEMADTYQTKNNKMADTYQTKNNKMANIQKVSCTVKMADIKMSEI
jgi:hypothetical protein